MKTKEAEVLRVLIKKAEAGSLQQDCDIVIEQIRAVDNKRLFRKIAVLPPFLVESVKENIAILLDLE
ncbi:MAG: type II toxin-antitoxin system PemK/MazF family toxin [Bacteroidales bacterium]